MTIITSISNPMWANEEHTAIDCDITTLTYGNLILPFTANKFDCEEHGRKAFEDIVSGMYGEIAEYVAPVNTSPPADSTPPENQIPVEIL